MTRSIRFAILKPEGAFQDWQARCLASLLTLDKVRLVLSILVEDTRNSRITSSHSIGSCAKRLLIDMYSKYLIRATSISTRNASQILSAIPVIRCEVAGGRDSLALNEEDVQKISTYDLDFILWFGRGTIHGKILNLPRYGVWRFSHHSAISRDAGLPCFWEIYNRGYSAGAMLLRMTGQHDSSVILKRGFWRTDVWSYKESIDEILYETAEWPARVCADIRDGNSEYLNGADALTDLPAIQVPTAWQMLRFQIRIIENWFIKVFRSLFCHDQWNIGIVYEPIHSLLDSKPTIHYLPSPKNGTFLADPFGIIKDNKMMILCEQFAYRSCRGLICSIELADRLHPGQPSPVIDLPIHVSYPYLIHYGGELYCVPETAAAREIALYRSERFPHTWIKVATLIEGIAATDATVFQYQGLWWLMCTDKEKNPFVNLYAWYAGEVLGPWKPHAANPIKTDIRSARPAGTPFSYGGSLYRPAQDCSRTYGGRVVINRILLLTPKVFREEEVAAIEPDPGSPFPDGVHTISAVGNMTLIDGKRVVFVGSAFKRTLLRGLMKMYGRIVLSKTLSSVRI